MLFESTVIQHATALSLLGGCVSALWQRSDNATPISAARAVAIIAGSAFVGFLGALLAQYALDSRTELILAISGLCSVAGYPALIALKETALVGLKYRITRALGLRFVFSKHYQGPDRRSGHDRRRSDHTGATGGRRSTDLQPRPTDLQHRPYSRQDHQSPPPFDDHWQPPTDPDTYHHEPQPPRGPAPWRRSDDD